MQKGKNEIKQRAIDKNFISFLWDNSPNKIAIKQKKVSPVEYGLYSKPLTLKLGIKDDKSKDVSETPRPLISA